MTSFIMVLFIMLYAPITALADWDSAYKNAVSVHTAACCTTCSPQYCVYVYCQNDISETNPIVANPNDQCVCDTKGGIKRYELGEWVDVSEIDSDNYSTNCTRGVYSPSVVGSTTYTAPAAGSYDAFDIFCLNNDGVALASVGLGVGRNYCEGEQASSIRRYTYAATAAPNPSLNFYNHIYFCADGTRDYAWQRTDLINASDMCLSSSTIGKAFLDSNGKIALMNGASSTPTPVP